MECLLIVSIKLFQFGLVKLNWEYYEFFVVYYVLLMFYFGLEIFWCLWIDSFRVCCSLLLVDGDFFWDRYFFRLFFWCCLN